MQDHSLVAAGASLLLGLVILFAFLYYLGRIVAELDRLRLEQSKQLFRIETSLRAIESYSQAAHQREEIKLAAEAGRAEIGD